MIVDVVLKLHSQPESHQDPVCNFGVCLTTARRPEYHEVATWRQNNEKPAKFAKIPPKRFVYHHPVDVQTVFGGFVIFDTFRVTLLTQHAVSNYCSQLLTSQCSFQKHGVGQSLVTKKKRACQLDMFFA